MTGLSYENRYYAVIILAFDESIYILSVCLLGVRFFSPK